MQKIPTVKQSNWPSSIQPAQGESLVHMLSAEPQHKKAVLYLAEAPEIYPGFYKHFQLPTTDRRLISQEVKKEHMQFEPSLANHTKGRTKAIPYCKNLFSAALKIMIYRYCTTAAAVHWDLLLKGEKEKLVQPSKQL